MISDGEKLKRLFDLYEKKMYRTAFQILKDAGQAEDAVQDAFIKVMSYLDKIKDPEASDTKHYMVRVIRSSAIDIYRKNQKDLDKLLWDPEDIFKDQMSFEDKNLVQIENRSIIKHMLAALSPKYREVLELKHYFGLSHREIALLLGVSENVVSKRYERAKRIVLEMMGDEVHG